MHKQGSLQRYRSRAGGSGPPRIYIHISLKPKIQFKTYETRRVTLKRVGVFVRAVHRRAEISLGESAPLCGDEG